MIILSLILLSLPIHAAELAINQAAPLFTALNQNSEKFDLAQRKGKWTVLYFYPKAGTPGCTKQACAYRDSIEKIRELGAEVFGISSDTVQAQSKFYKEHHLNFDLLADPEAKVIDLYGSKMPVVSFSKRWTFVIGPDLKIISLMKDVDPALDSQKVADAIKLAKKIK
jgi:peroxiredoxin Q/BCP